MSMKRRDALATLGASCAGAFFGCGVGVTPFAGPSATVGTRVLSGRTGLPVTGLVTSPVPDGTKYAAPGFLALVTSKGGDLLLRPSDSALSFEYTKELAYHEGMITRLGLYVRRASIILIPEMRRPDVLKRLEGVVQTLNRVQQVVRFSLDDYSADLSIPLRFDANDKAFVEPTSTVAVARFHLSSTGAINDPTIIFPSVSYVDHVGWFEMVLMHEVGHVLGLWHTPSGVPGVMSAILLGAGTDFSDAEKTTFRTHYTRSPGTKLKDRIEYEDVVARSSDGTREVSIACPLG